MTTKKDLAVTALTTFCITATLFMVIPTQSSNSPYDPWMDYNDDGVIGLADLVALANMYGTSGVPINKTDLLLQLQNKIAELEERLAYLEGFHPPKSGLICYWKFDEGEGVTAYDSSGCGNNGMLVDGPMWVEGKYSGGLNFNGSNYMYVESSPSIVIHQYVSVECWIRVSGPTGDHQILLTQNTESIAHYTLEIQPDGRTLQFAVHPHGQNVYAVSQVQTNFGEWAHIVGTYDGNTVYIYVNGNSTGSAPCVGQLDVVDFPIWVGSHTPNAWWDRNWFNGTIDNLMLYNRVLTEEEVLAHYLYPPQ